MTNVKDIVDLALTLHEKGIELEQLRRENSNLRHALQGMCLVWDAVVKSIPPLANQKERVVAEDVLKGHTK